MDFTCNRRWSWIHNVPSNPLGIPNTRVERNIMAKYDVEVQLSGEDGNAFSIMARVQRALKQAGATPEEISQYHEESTSGDYDNLLLVASQWVRVA